MYACRICAVNYWYRAYYNLGQNAADNESLTSPSCERCPLNARCGGGLCLPEPKMGYWSQGIDSSTTNPDGENCTHYFSEFYYLINIVILLD